MRVAQNYVAFHCRLARGGVHDGKAYCSAVKFESRCLSLSVILDVTERHTIAVAFQADLRFKWIMSKDTAAGVTPGIRPAWPSVSGRSRASFSPTSADKPRTVA